MYVVFFEVVDIGVVLQELQQFVNDGVCMQFFGGQQWEVVFEFEFYLLVEDGLGIGVGVIVFVVVVFEDMVYQIQILLYGVFERFVGNLYFKFKVCQVMLYWWWCGCNKVVDR